MKSSEQDARGILHKTNIKNPDKECEAFCSRLANFPHSFQIKIYDKLTSTNMIVLQEELERALKVGYSTPLETARARNLLSFAYFRQKHPGPALNELEQACKEEGERQNIVSMANKAFILWKTGKRLAAQTVVDDLENLQKDTDVFEYIVVKAKAELAFSYTQMSYCFYPSAVFLFEEVIPKAREPEKWLWTFGLALTLRRMSHLHMAPEFGPDARSTERSLHILRLFQGVINNSSKHLQAKAYAELGLLLNNNRNNRKVLRAARMEAVEACERALQLDDQDNSVLVKCSRIFRYHRISLQRCCSLLQTALQNRLSSTAYHHLGLTYKAMATELKYPKYGDRKYNGNNYVRKRFVYAKLKNRRRNSHKTVQESTQDCIEMLRRMVKSPEHETRFSRDDKYVRETVDNFEKAKSLTEGENKSAVYDLALFYKALGEYEKALEELEEIRCSEDTLSITRINAFEQSGLILLTMIETETDINKKMYLKKEGESMLNMALSMAARNFSNNPQFQGHIQEIWQAFSALFNALDNCDLTPESVLLEKARLLQVIRKLKDSKELLQEVLKISPSVNHNPEFVKMRVEIYIGEKDFERAAACITCQTVEVREQVKELFEDEKYLQKICFEAGKRVLIQTHETTSLAQEYFRFAFDEMFTTANAVANVTEYAQDVGCDRENYLSLLQVLFIHDQQTKSEMTNARKVACLVRHVCGLRTSWSVEEWTPGCDVDDEIKQIQESRLVVVIVGSEDMSPEFRMSVSYAVQTRPTKTLLLDGSRVPEVLRKSPVLQCPQVILDMDVDDYEMQTQDRVEAICNIFSFLISDNSE